MGVIDLNNLPVKENGFILVISRLAHKEIANYRAQDQKILVAVVTVLVLIVFHSYEA
jgi:hypothetical protein